MPRFSAAASFIGKWWAVLDSNDPTLVGNLRATCRGQPWEL